MTYRTSIADWPEDDRPREKLIKLGTEALSEAELLAIILRVGNRELSAIDLARKILHQCGGFRGIDKMDVADLTQVKGVGIAKAAQIKAAIAIGKKLLGEQSRERPRITCGRDVFELVHLRYRDLKRERFSILMLTTRNRVIAEKVLFEGSVAESLVSPREVIREIIQAGAAQVIFIHNHPSGEVTPSRADHEVTQKLKAACATIEVTVLDHLIIGDNRYFSFAEEGIL